MPALGRLFLATIPPATEPVATQPGQPGPSGLDGWLERLRQLDLSDPFTQRVALLVGAFILLVILLRMFGRWRERAAIRRRSAELRRGFDELRLQQEEIRRLADNIVATSSTARIAGYAIVRQIETVFTEGRPSSVAAMELLKGLAAQKGANGIINVQTRQLPTGKWVAGGDAVLVRLIGRREPGDAPAPPGQGSK
ncbi:MAG: hypothetical protein AB1716_10370 [Planctomycetota bacterium]